MLPQKIIVYIHDLAPYSPYIYSYLIEKASNFLVVRECLANNRTLFETGIFTAEFCILKH